MENWSNQIVKLLSKLIFWFGGLGAEYFLGQKWLLHCYIHLDSVWTGTDSNDDDDSDEQKKRDENAGTMVTTTTNAIASATHPSWRLTVATIKMAGMVAASRRDGISTNWVRTQK